MPGTRELVCLGKRRGRTFVIEKRSVVWCEEEARCLGHTRTQTMKDEKTTK